MQFHDLLIGVLAFISELLGTVSGFGSSTFFVPLATIFETFQLVIVLTAILHCFSNSWRLYLFREKLSAKLFGQIAVPSIVFTGIGALGTAYLDVTVFRKSLGVVLILVAVVFMLKAHKNRRFPMWLASSLAALSGFATGLVGTGGAIRAVVLTGLGFEKNAFVFMSSSIDFFGDFVRMTIYLQNGFMDWSQWYYLPILAMTAYAGTKCGKLFITKMHPRFFETVVSVFILIGGITMLL